MLYDQPLPLLAAKYLYPYIHTSFDVLHFSSASVPVAASSAARASRLGLEDAAILADDPVAASCSLSGPELKVLWVVNSENYIYKRNSLNRAKQVRYHFLLCFHENKY